MAVVTLGGLRLLADMNAAARETRDGESPLKMPKRSRFSVTQVSPNRPPERAPQGPVSGGRGGRGVREDLQAPVFYKTFMATGPGAPYDVPE